MGFREINDLFFMRMSYSRSFDGLWIGVSSKKDMDLIGRVEDALRLIKQHDNQRYLRILRDVERIWISLRIGFNGQFNTTLKACYLDERYVKNSSAKVVASLIVHEATHGYPCLNKMKNNEKSRYRIEQICIRQELTFARRLPNAKKLCLRLEEKLNADQSFWSDAQMTDKINDQTLATIKYLGLPNWPTKLLLGLAKLQAKRLARRR